MCPNGVNMKLQELKHPPVCRDTTTCNRGPHGIMLHTQPLGPRAHEVFYVWRYRTVRRSTAATRQCNRYGSDHSAGELRQGFRKHSETQHTEGMCKKGRLTGKQNTDVEILDRLLQVVRHAPTLPGTDSQLFSQGLEIRVYGRFFFGFWP